MNNQIRFGVESNVELRVLNPDGEIIHTHEGHNMATHRMCEGIGKFLCGHGVFGQAPFAFRGYIPSYISCGTMGLAGQSLGSDGLPFLKGTEDSTRNDPARLEEYVRGGPHFSSDGYVLGGGLTNITKGRWLGLGVPYPLRTKRISDEEAKEALKDDETNLNNSIDGKCKVCGGDINLCTHTQLTPKGEDWKAGDYEPYECELVSEQVERMPIEHRDLANSQAGLLSAQRINSVDTILTAYSSLGYFDSFRYAFDGGYKSYKKDYILISEVGLWANAWVRGNSAQRYMLAGYRIRPSNRKDWDNPEKVRSSIIRINKGQILEIVWKLQIIARDPTRYLYDATYGENGIIADGPEGKDGQDWP